MERKRDLILAGVLCALLVTTTAAAVGDRSPRGRTLAVPGGVRELAADGSRAAILLGPSNRCGVLVDWVETAGGNLLEMTLKTATTAHRTAMWVSFVGSGPDVEGDYIGEVLGKGRRLFFTEYERCAESQEGEPPGPWACPPGRHTGDVIRTQVWLFDPSRPGAHCPGVTAFNRCRLLTSSSNRTRLLSTDGSRFALRLAGGSIELRNAAGTLLRTFAVGTGPIEAVLSRSRLLVHRGSTLQLYDLGSGARAGMRPAPAGWTLVDTAAGLAVLLDLRLARAAVYLLRLTDGKTAKVRVPGTGAVHAQLESPGLYYSYTGRVAFIPLKQVLARFG